MSPLLFAAVDAAYRQRSAWALRYGLTSEAALQMERCAWWRSAWGAVVMDTQIRRKLNMSDNRGRFECACRTRLVYGSAPDRDCSHCDGTGYTNNPDHVKDWSKDPEDEDSEW